jgi:hypothetical protein
MSATNVLQVGEPMPRVGSVVADEDLRVRVTWRGAASSERKAGLVDLAPAIFTYKIYRPLRDNPRLFRSVHVINDGNAIAWGSKDEIDMSAMMLEHLAGGMMEQADFREFLQRNKLTLEAAAAQLGISRRLAAYYASGQKFIPRYIALACANLDREHGRLGATATMRGRKGRDDRQRDTGGRTYKKRGDTLVGTLREEYGSKFAADYGPRTKLGTVLKREGVKSLDQLLKKR